MLTGVKNSVNNYFTQLELKVGMCPVVTMAKDLGITQADGEDIMRYQYMPSFTLGTADVPPLKLVAAYATFAARGIYCDPVIVNGITSTSGKEFEPPSANCHRAISEDLADAITKIFQGPYNGGTATAAKVPGVQMAGKTGTLNSYRAVWTMGITPNLAGGAMLSIDPDPSFKSFWKSHPRLLRYVKLPASGTSIAGSSGRDAGFRFLRPVFMKAMETRPKEHFHEPSANILRGEMVNVPSCSGKDVKGCTAVLTRAGFAVGTEDVFSDTVAKGGVMGTKPSGRAPKGSEIVIQVSKGPKAPPPPPIVPPTPPPTPPTPPPRSP